MSSDIEHKSDGREHSSRLNDLEIRLNSLNNQEELLKSKIESVDAKVNGCATVDEVREALKEMKTDMLSKVTEMREDIVKLDK